MTSMVQHWSHPYYDVDIPPLFYIVQRSCEDDSDEDESIEAATYFAGCVDQEKLWKRIYHKHILREDGEEAEASEERYWALKQEIKKHVHV